MALLQALLTEPFGKNVIHGDGRESDREGVVRLVSGHGSDVDILGVVEIGQRGVVNSEELSYFTDTVGAVVEEEERIVVLKK